MAKMSKYTLASSNGQTNVGNHHDCVVRALANVTGYDYEAAEQICKQYGREHNSGMKCSLHTKMFLDHGFKLVGCFGKTLTASTVEHFYKKHTGKTPEFFPGISVGRAMEIMREGKYIVIIHGHAFAVIDGKLIDKGPIRSRSYVCAIWILE